MPISESVKENYLVHKNPMPSGVGVSDNNTKEVIINMKKLLKSLIAIALSMSLLSVAVSPSLASEVSFSKIDNSYVSTQVIKPSKVTLNKKITSINVGSTETLTPTITPATATNQLVAWKSSNKSIATVNSITGEVKGIKEGKTIITVTTEDGKKTAKCIVTITPNSSPITFKDINFEKVIRKTLNKPIGDITSDDVQKITRLTISDESIKDISGIEYFTNLREFSLSDSSVSDISSLSGLIKLKKLSLPNNEIIDITPLKGLTNLIFLDLKNSSLEYIGQHKNRISNISALSGLKNLKNLCMSSDYIQDYSPLGSLSGLKSLYLTGMPVSDYDYYIKILKDILPNCNVLFGLI